MQKITHITRQKFEPNTELRKLAKQLTIKLLASSSRIFGADNRAVSPVFI